MNYPSLVSLREVAPRDGWQKFKTVLPTEVKRELICSMIDYGARELEIGVFSSDPRPGAGSTRIWTPSAKWCSPTPPRRASE